MMMIIVVTRFIFRVNLEIFKRFWSMHANYPKTHDVVGIKIRAALEAHTIKLIVSYRKTSKNFSF